MTKIQELELSFNWRGLDLNGSLHLPEVNGPSPVIVMIQGSGAADRNSGGYFEPIRQTFLEHKIATFAFDKPGCGASSGDWRNFGLDDRADQVLAALANVRDEPAVDQHLVGVFGHSQGGWIVQKLAALDESLALAIGNSAPSISVQEQIVYEIERSGLGPEAIELTRSLVGAAQDQLDFESVSTQLLQPAGSQPWFAEYPTIEDAEEWGHFVLTVNEPHDPTSDLRRVKIPFLSVYGGLDPLLPPWRGAEETGLALADAGNTDATVVVYPTGDHRIQIRDASKSFASGYLDQLGTWAANRFDWARNAGPAKPR